ncbi:MAG: hypothetical protein LBL57_03575 [Tannerella sp.]|jgi:hypothetical protein|nr:hypothetical protein [Tannerella sp.]
MNLPNDCFDENLSQVAVHTTECYFSKTDLYEIFSHRLYTQNRPHHKISFPIRAIKSLLYKKSKEDRIFIDEWIKKQIDETIVITKEKEFKFRDIKALSIDDGVVKVYAEGEVFELYSRTWDGTGKFEMKNIKSLGQIVLDHITSKRTLLNDLSSEDGDEKDNKLPVLCGMTERIYRNINITNEKAYIQRISVLLKYSAFERVDIPALKKELELIGSQIHLQLMESKENAKKGHK